MKKIILMLIMWFAIIGGNIAFAECNHTWILTGTSTDVTHMQNNSHIESYQCNICGETKEEDASCEFSVVEGSYVSNNQYSHMFEQQCWVCGITQSVSTYHSGGVATCSSGPICSYCGAEYGSPTYDHVSESDYRSDATGHWKECRSCPYKTVSKTSHVDSSPVDEKCDVCGYAMCAHTAGDWTVSGENHVQTCTKCSAVVNTHTPEWGGWKIDTKVTNKHDRSCKTCGLTESHAANSKGGYEKIDGNDTYHYAICECGIKRWITHTGSWQRTYKVTSGSTRVYYHTRRCSVCSYSVSHLESANIKYVTQNGNHVKKCERCTMSVGSSHTPNWTYTTVDSSNHTKSCSSCDISETESHSGGTATCTKGPICSLCETEYGSALGHTGGTATCISRARCTRCGATYGSALGHTGGTATCVSGATCTRCGVIYGSALGHTYGKYQLINGVHRMLCTTCGTQLSSHTPSWEYTAKDSSNHTKTCSSCTISTIEAHTDVSPKDSKCDNCGELLSTSGTYINTIKAKGTLLRVMSLPGSVITIIPKAAEITGWEVEEGNATVQNNKFTMPAGNVVINAIV